MCGNGFRGSRRLVVGRAKGLFLGVTLATCTSFTVLEKLENVDGSWVYVSRAFPCCVNGFAAWFLSLGEEALAHPTEAGRRKRKNKTVLPCAVLSFQIPCVPLGESLLRFWIHDARFGS